MKTPALTIPLALLVSTFTWGCQEQGSSPVGPGDFGPQFNHGGPPPHDPAGGGTFTVAVSGRDAEAVPPILLLQGSKSTTTVAEKPTLGVVAKEIEITFLDAFRDMFIFPPGTNCFKNQPISGTLDVRQDKEDATKAAATFFFDAFDGKGEKEVSYTLTLSDGSIAGAWLPAVGNTTVVTGTKWRMKGPGKAGRTCNSAAPDISYTISIERTS
ncbi:MAG: hypothetical protein ACE5JR_05630 [Gemmatimonadota bacterium]